MEARRKRALVLMADDDHDDILITKDAIEEVAPDIKFKSVTDGQQLIDYLSCATKDRDNPESPCPELILLDLNMPRKDGFDVLGEMRTNPSLKAIPVIILSTSSEERDITRSYKMGANSYITKPKSYGEFVTAMNQTLNYWFGVTSLPKIC